MPLDKSVEILEKSEMLAKCHNILLKVKEYIDEFLDPSKASYVDNLTVNKTLKFCNIAKVDYYDALSLSPTSDYEIHLRRPPNSCFINNYSPFMLKAWRANMDLQPVFNYYRAVSYMPTYFSTSELETSETLLQACREIRSMNLHTRETMHKLASSYSSSKQVPLQEAAYCSLPALWLIKCFLRTVFVNTSIPSESIRICKSVEKTEALNPDSTDIVRRTMEERYIDRPNGQYKNGMYGIVDHICFAAHYNLDYENEDKNDSQLDALG